MRSGIFRFLGLVLPVSLAFASPAFAADTYPTRPITIVVPYPAGGSTDELARVLGQSIESKLGQTVVVVNRGGASGAIGATSVARAAPDGYTLLLASGVQMSVNPLLIENLTYNPVTDLTPVIYATAMPSVVVVNPSFPVEKASDLVPYLRANPKAFSYASSSAGTPSHLGMEIFKKMTGTDVVHIPYRGGAPALLDLVGGQVQMMFAYIPEALPYIRANRLRALAVTTRQRSPLLPEMPTLIEAGIPDYELVGYFGIVAPKGTPSEIVSRLNALLNDALRKPEVNERLAAQGFITVGGTPEDFGRYIAAETAKWTSVVKGN